jgi:hypothetical protein
MGGKLFTSQTPADLIHQQEEKSSQDSLAGTFEPASPETSVALVASEEAHEPLQIGLRR